MYCSAPIDVRHDIPFVPRPPAREGASKKTRSSSFRRTYPDRPARVIRNNRRFSNSSSPVCIPRRCGQTLAFAAPNVPMPNTNDTSFVYKLHESRQRQTTSRLCTKVRFEERIQCCHGRSDAMKAVLMNGSLAVMMRLSPEESALGSRRHSQPMASAGNAHVLTQSSRICLSAGVIVAPKGMKPESTTSPMRCQRSLSMKNGTRVSS